MFSVDYIRTLFDYTYWAHGKVWACALALSDEQFTHDLGYSWGSIRGQFVHVMSAEWIWFERLQGNIPTAMLAEVEYPTREAIRSRWDEIETTVRGYLAGLTDAALAGDFTYKTTKGAEYTQPMWQTLAHVVNHGTDHRAQILAMLHQLGAPTVEQDLVFYFRERGKS